jgi:hypothetical protein
MRIKLTYPASEFVFRQTPGAAGVWEDCTFSTDEDNGPFDGWVVYDSLPRPCAAGCDPQRTIFVTGEPASVHSYDPQFLAQFAAVISPHPALRHPRVFRQQPAVPWWAGVVIDYQPAKQASAWRLDYDHFKAMTPGLKPKCLSVICSNKTLTAGHRERLRFLERLMEHFGSALDVFGHGLRPVTDKWDAIHPYRYHIVLENVRADHYWTEKLADNFLAGAFPFYCGCPNLGDYFPAGSYCAIDRHDPDAALAAISAAIAADVYESAVPLLAEARALVLDRYNLFPEIVKAMRALPRANQRTVRLRPECDFVDSMPRRLKRRVRQVVLGR